MKKGTIMRISGPVVEANLEGALYDVVRVGKQELLGEIVEVKEHSCLIQVYEDTSMIKPGEPVENKEEPLSLELGPGLLGGVFDGVGRPLNTIRDAHGTFIPRGINVATLDRKKKYLFTPSVKEGSEVTQGTIIGTVKENARIMHHIMVPLGVNGKISNLKKGEFTIDKPIAKVGATSITLMQSWPVRKARPYLKRESIKEPLITGVRVLDFLFPIAKGGVAAIPGPFGSGKSVVQQQLARWSDADIIVYIGCGERGNEITDVLEEFPKIIDPKSGKSLMERTILIANTSNMPVAAREASVYTGITIAEYFRDQGYHVALMADSTSRWAEAMREISGRLEEMPGEEGFPAYLSKRLAEFYERAGMVKTLSKKTASITVIGAVSPPGGDFSEPVTQNTLRLAGVFWALDANLANRRHYPSINWLQSYTQYFDTLAPFYETLSKDWSHLRSQTMELLQKEAEILEIAQLVGVDALPDDQQILLIIARIIREDFLQQDAFHEVDTTCSGEKQIAMIKNIFAFYESAKNKSPKQVRASKELAFLSQMKYEADKKQWQK